jgi:hypothetical protein
MRPSTLYRLAGLAGILSALVLVFAAARRGGVIPANMLTHGVSPLASILGLLALTGLYLVQRREAGTLGLVGYALNFVGLAGVVGIEFTINNVFPYLDRATVDALLAGTTGTMFVLTSMVFLLGVVGFGLATWRAGLLPRPAALLYVVGLVPVALRGVVPDATVPAGQVLAAAGIAWLSAVLWQAGAPARVQAAPA